MFSFLSIELYGIGLVASECTIALQRFHQKIFKTGASGSHVINLSNDKGVLQN
jgi:hypothetical protein